MRGAERESLEGGTRGREAVRKRGSTCRERMGARVQVPSSARREGPELRRGVRAAEGRGTSPPCALSRQEQPRGTTGTTCWPTAREGPPAAPLGGRPAQTRGRWWRADPPRPTEQQEPPRISRPVAVPRSGL